jgi:aldehyde:ferredoxin oxidoreductase
MKGVFNKILRINLKTKTCKEEIIPGSIYENCLGGKGLGTHLLTKENLPGVAPLSPQNKLIFCIGPATDSRIYGSCRHGVFTKSMEGKAKLFLEFEDRFNIHDSLILCRFYRDIYWDWNYLSAIVELTTGRKLDEKALRKISSNIQNETRRFNLREGITAKDDTLPKRFFDEPLGKGEKTIRREDLQKMLQDYYSLRGWNSEGVPES